MELPVGMNIKLKICLSVLMCGLMLLWSSPLIGGEVDVIAVEISPTGPDMYRLSVTLRHKDEGWQHYADKWEVLDEQGNVLGTRVLMHPHVNEQPFTRSLVVSLPMALSKVIIRGHDKIHGYGGREMVKSVP